MGARPAPAPLMLCINNPTLIIRRSEHRSFPERKGEQHIVAIKAGGRKLLGRILKIQDLKALIRLVCEPSPRVRKPLL